MNKVAMNAIGMKGKGEVVVYWMRDDDEVIIAKAGTTRTLKTLKGVSQEYDLDKKVSSWCKANGWDWNGEWQAC